jgi:D-alanine-D-alanine ligase-like ATP-grasp enzyme
MEKQHKLILNEAISRSYTIEKVENTDSPLSHLIHSNNQILTLLNGSPRELISKKNEDLFDDKGKLSNALSNTFIKTINNLIVNDLNSSETTSFIKNKNRFVCKPTIGTEGIGVELDLKTMDDLKSYWQRNKHLCDEFLLEEQIDKKDFRVQVINGEIMAACTRVPARVSGNGIDKLSELIDQAIIQVKANNPSNNLIIDQESKSMIAQQGFQMNDIIPVGIDVQLKKLANMSQGALAIDLSDSIHTGYYKWIKEIVALTNSTYFAVDFLTNHPEKDPMDHAHLLEINARPEWLHHTFSEGKSHPIEKYLLDAYFES